MDALFLDHYDRELAYLRDAGSAFAAKYPTLAGQLGLDEFQCSDPFVERLLEGFAFMAARVQRRLDAEFPQLTRSLLDAVFPHYTRPIPSTAIFQLNPAHDEGSLIEGFRVPKGTRLHSEPATGQQTGCRFDTTADVELWPIRISQVGCIHRDTAAGIPLPPFFLQSSIHSVLHLTLETTAAVPFKALKLDSLRLHLRGGEIAHQIFEALSAHVHTIAASSATSIQSLTTESWQMLEGCQLHTSAMDTNEMLLPSDSRSFSGYCLLQDYFVLPEKFLFLDFSGLQGVITKATGNQLHFLFALDRAPGRHLSRISTDHIALHCVPAVNLFPKRADRVQLDHAQHEHQLIADRSRPIDFEIWSVEELAANQTDSLQETPCLSLYAPSHSNSQATKHPLYYTLERRDRVPSENQRHPTRSPYLGTEVYLSLTDSQRQPALREFQQLSAKVLCTNRDLPLLPPQRGWRTAFRAEAVGPIANVLCLTGPTSPRPPLVSKEGERAWRLVSHLAPNYLSLSDTPNGGAAMLREILQLYCIPGDHSSQRQIEGVSNIRHKTVVRRVPLPGPLTFAQGLEVELICDEEAFEGSGAFLLGAILEQFFARFVTINSFTETHLVSAQRGSIHRWPTRVGTTPLL